MAHRYRNEHYEDVARILLEHILLSHVTPMTRDLVDSFADLFAADNLPVCPKCGRESLESVDTGESIYEENAAAFIDRDVSCSWGCADFALMAPDFNRTQFLAACGLEA